MNDFLKKLKTRVNNLELPKDTAEVNEDALWNNIQAGITDKVEKDKRRGFIFIFKFSLLIASLIFLCFVTSLYFQNSKQEEQKDVIAEQQKSIVERNEKLDSVKPLNGEKNDLNQNSKIQPTKNSVGFTPSQSSLNSTVINNALPKNKAKLIESNNSVIIDKNDNEEEIKRVENISIAKQNNDEVQQSNKQLNIPLITAEETDKITLAIPSIFSFVEQNQSDLLFNLSKNKNPYPKKKRIVDLGFFAGTHLLHSKLNSNLTDNQTRKNLLDSGLKPQFGYSASAEISFKLFKKMKITSGFEYAYSAEQFNYQVTWDTTFQTNQNINIYQVNRRVVRHHNKHSFFSVPVLLGMEFTKGKFEIGTSIGIGLNFLKSQRGRSLSNNLEVVDFPSSDINNLSPLPNFYISYLVRPYLNYKLKDNLKIQIRPDFRFQNFGTSAFYNNMKYSSILTGVQAGIIVDLFK